MRKILFIILLVLLMIGVSCSMQKMKENTIIVPVKAVKIIMDEITQGKYNCEYLFENEEELLSGKLTKSQIGKIRFAKLVFLFELPTDPKTLEKIKPYSDKIILMNSFINQVNYRKDDPYLWLDLDHYINFARGIYTTLSQTDAQNVMLYDSTIKTIIDGYKERMEQIHQKRSDKNLIFTTKYRYLMDYANREVLKTPAQVGEKNSIDPDIWCKEKYSSTMDYVNKQLNSLF